MIHTRSLTRASVGGMGMLVVVVVAAGAIAAAAIVSAGGTLHAARTAHNLPAVMISCGEAAAGQPREPIRIGPSDVDDCLSAPCIPLFPPDNPWNTDISALSVHPNSANFIASIGASTGLHPDFGTGVGRARPTASHSASCPRTSPWSTSTSHSTAMNRTRARTRCPQMHPSRAGPIQTATGTSS